MHDRLLNKIRISPTEQLGLFYCILSIVFILVGYLNHNSNLMGNIVPYYLDFSKIIGSGFDPSAAVLGRPTFPMWGYGFILGVFDDRHLIFFLQAAIAFATVGLAVPVVERRLGFSPRGKIGLRILVILSFSWVAVHYTLSPYSLSISLMILFYLSFCESLDGRFRRGLFFSALSGMLCGLILNFRSDYIYLFIFTPFLYLFFGGSLALRLQKTFIYFVAFGALMAPWGFYTLKTTGEYRITSTNSGHVLFIGLGNLPNNVWGITTSDADPRKARELNAAGLEDSLTMQGDKFLTERFIELVADYPGEYLRKVGYSAVVTMISGIYVPEFYGLQEDCYRHARSVRGDVMLQRQYENQDFCRVRFIDEVKTNPLTSLLSSLDKFIYYGMTYFSIAYGLIVNLLSLIIMPVCLLFFRGFKSPYIILAAFIVLYQFLINSFAFQMKLYSTFSYFFGVLVLALAIDFFFFRSHFEKSQ